MNQAQGDAPAVPALERLAQKDHQFKAVLQDLVFERGGGPTRTTQSIKYLLNKQKDLRLSIRTRAKNK